MNVLQFNFNKLFIFEDIKIFIFLRLGFGLPNHAPFLKVFGEFWPLNVVGRCMDPKRHILTWFRVIWAIVRQNRPAGYFS